MWILRQAARFRSSGGATAAIRDHMTFVTPMRNSGWLAQIVCRTMAWTMASLLALIASGSTGAHAQSEVPIETELLAVRRVMPDAGPGLRGVCRGPDGKYYVLSAPGAAVVIYDAAGRRVGQVPAQAVAP